MHSLGEGTSSLVEENELLGEEEYSLDEEEGALDEEEDLPAPLRVTIETENASFRPNDHRSRAE